MRCFEHCMSSRLTNSIRGLVISTNIEECGTEKYFVLFFKWLFKWVSWSQRNGFRTMHNTYCLLKLSCPEHTLSSVNI